MTIVEIGRHVLNELKSCGIETYILDTQIILSYILKLEKHQLVTENQSKLTEDQISHINSALLRRKKHEPIAYITGQKEFYSLDFIVNPDVLIPRPETEQLVDLAIFYAKPGNTVLDIGTGSGAIAVALKKNRPDLLIHACDISEKALNTAKINADNILGKDQISFSKSDLFKEYKDKKFDLIISNPPYIDKNISHTLQKELFHEPEAALFAKDNGKQIIGELISQGKDYLKENGHLIIEIGYDQELFVKAAGSENNYSTSVIKDYSGLPRIALLKTISGNI